MARPEFNQPEISDGKDLGRVGHAGPNARVEAQLNNQTDVSQAHQFFQAKGDVSLPNVNLHGTESAAAGAKAVGAGGEQVMSHVATGAEHALGALAQPGEPISPMIQMIMKMPGLTGIMNSFFEFLGALIHGNILDALNPANWLEHAADAISGMADHFSVSLDMLPADAPVLHFDGSNFMSMDSSMQVHSDALSGADKAANVGAPVDNANLNNAVFEKAADTTTDYPQHSLLDYRPNNELAMGGDTGVYRPTTGGYYQSTGTSASTTTPTTSASTHAAAQPAHHTASHGGGHHFKHHDAPAEQPREIAESQPHVESSTDGSTEATPDAGDATTTTDATTNSGGEYTVQHGDSLWDIARKQLGDGSRWSEIYKMNADVIGSNPDVIQPGMELHMPDGSSIASADHYVVQPGDNLWNIARHHMGGGQNWGEIYRINHDAIGGNPNLIHPGQELALNGDGGGAVADAGAPDSSMASAPPDSAPTASAPHTVSAPHATAHHAPVHHAPAHETMAANPSPISQTTAPVADHTQVAANYPHSTPGSMQHAAGAEHAAGGGMLQAETPMMAPTDGSAAAGNTISHGAGSEHTINSATQVPAEQSNQMYQGTDGSLFYKKQP